MSHQHTVIAILEAIAGKEELLKQALPGHLIEGPVTQERIKIVLKRIRQMIALNIG